MANSKEIFSKNVKYLLKKNDLSRETVARVLGVKYTTFLFPIFITSLIFI